MHTEDESSVGVGWMRWNPGNIYYDEGNCVTPHGIVSVYRQDHAGLALTILQFVKDGRFYDRRYKKQYTRRGCVTLAKRFASEISGLAGKP